MYQITRTTRRLTCGLATGAIGTIALLGGPLLGSAVADTATAPTNGAWTQDGPDRERFRRAQEERRSAGGEMSMEQLIDRMTGTWMVEVSISPRHFQQRMQGDTLASPERRMREDRPQRRGGQGGRASQSGNDAGSGSGSQPGRSAADEMMTVEGFATFSSMMGDTMLRERMFTDDPRLMPGKHRKGDWNAADRGARTGEETGDRAASGKEAMSRDATLAGIAWFDLDEDANEYSAVFIGNGTDEIHHATGRLSGDGRRIVFHGSRMLDDDRRMQGRNKGPVVLEWMDDGKFAVTMYTGRRMGDGADRGVRGARGRNAGALTDDPTRSAAGGAGGGAGAGAGAGQADREQDRDRTGARDRARERARDMDQMNPENIVYRAVYTKASGNRKRELDQRIEKIVSEMK